MKKFPRSRGAALIIVLSILVLVSGLVVGLAMAMRKERSASFYHLERLRADLLARQGADYGHALLTSATTTNRFWVSGPGRILASASNSFTGATNLIDLSSGVTLSTNTNTATDLNRYGWSGGDRLLDPKGTNFNVQWIYVLKDGTYQTTATISTNVVGRFAFWVDDESSRIDISTANKRTTAATDWSNPAQIEMNVLPGLSDADVATLVSQANFGAFSTPYEALSLTNAAAALSTNRFSITHYTQDPDVNPWGENRIVLTAFGDRAFRRSDYINILTATNGDPGLLGSLSTAYVNATLAKVMNRLTQTNWPYVSDSSASLAKKYGANGAAQLALDIVEYVRSTESTNAFIEPLTATFSGTNITFDPSKTAATLAAGDLIGTTRRPMISEMGVWLDATNNSSGGYDGKLFVEVYMPAGYGLSPTNLPPVFIASDLTANALQSATAVPSTNQFVRLEQSFGITNTVRPTNVTLRIGLFKANSDAAANILDVAPLAAADKINYAIDPAGITENLINSWEVRDPRVNKYIVNWEHTGTNSMFPPGANSQWGSLIAPPAGQPGADRVSGSASSAMSDASVRMAANGRVGSVGELGFINTGVATNMPWRSVRLQPDPNTRTNIVPDWALMDLFSAPVPRTNFVPGLNLVAGRINLNALISSTNIARTNVLTALFTNTAVPNVATAVSNVIVAGNLADTGGSAGVGFGSLTNYRTYPSVGQLAEIKGIADTGEASEQVIRQVASLATVRGNVFSIYSVGQALQVTKAGKVNINGEKMVRSIVERTFNAAGEPQYKVIYWSEIYP